MVRTQIQLPDELYEDLETLAKDKEWSLAEAIRRAAEHLLRSYPKKRSLPASKTAALCSFLIKEC